MLYYLSHFFFISTYYRIAGKFGGGNLANLVNCPWFTKLKSSKLVLTINNLMVNLLICQLSFTKHSKRINSPYFPTAKLSWYTLTSKCFFLKTSNTELLCSLLWQCDIDKYSKFHSESTVVIFKNLTRLSSLMWHDLMTHMTQRKVTQLT